GPMTRTARTAPHGLATFLFLGACLLSSHADTKDRAEATLRAAREARRAARYDEAKRQLESYRLLNGAKAASDLESSLTQAQQGDIVPIEKYLRGLLEKKDRPEAGLILEALTRGYLENLQFEEAKATLKEWLVTKSSDAQGFYLRGWAREQLSADRD